MHRLFEKKDIAEIVAIENEVLHSSLGYDYYFADLKNPLAKHFVWLENREIIGFISTIFDGFSMEILNFGIRKKYQNQGFGTRLLAQVLDELVVLGMNVAVLEVRSSNQNAIGLYHKLGFHQIRIRTDYYSDGEDALVLQKLYTPKSDIANLEAILFSKKKGYRFISDFKERYALNYYDLYNVKVDSLDFIEDAPYIQMNTNWQDQKLFLDYEEDESILMHVGTYAYQSFRKKQVEVCPIKDWDEFMAIQFQENQCYGESYAHLFGAFLKQHQHNRMLVIGAYHNEQLVGYARMLFYEHAIFIDGVLTLENKRHQGVCSSIFDYVVNYAKTHEYFDIYLEADVDDTPIEMYQRMNFKGIERLYSYVKVKEWKKQM